MRDDRGARAVLCVRYVDVVHNRIEIVLSPCDVRRHDDESAGEAVLNVGEVDTDVVIAIDTLVLMHQPDSVSNLMDDAVLALPAALRQVDRSIVITGATD